MRNKNAKVSDPNKFISNPGDQDHILYSSKVMPDGTIHLTECGKENIQEIINSHRDTCDMNFILHQLNLGNTSVLNVREGFYADLTGAPKTMAEALQIMIEGEQAFNQLPVEVKQKFDNNYMQWLINVGNEDWLGKMSSVLPTTEEVNEEVKEGEAL